MKKFQDMRVPDANIVFHKDGTKTYHAKSNSAKDKTIARDHNKTEKRRNKKGKTWVPNLSMPK